MPEITLVGDIALTGIISSDPKKNAQRYSAIVPFFKEASNVFANLEVPIRVNNERNEYKNNIHYSELTPTEYMLKILNISCVSLANNHIFDCKMSGLAATINLLDRLGICHTGAGWKKEHVEPVIINKDGVKIGFLAYVDKSTNPRTENFSELLINYFDFENVEKKIIELKFRVDKIICSIHWGTDYSFYPTPKQVKAARELVDAGADIIMGHHSHTFQPFEKYKNSYIFYSLGTLTFGDYIREEKNELQALFRKTKKSAIVNYDCYNNQFQIQAIKELKGNQVILHRRDYVRWSNNKWLHYKFKNSCQFTKLIYDFSEKVLYRVYEYFFGYYKNPVKRLFQLSNLKKLKKLF